MDFHFPAHITPQEGGGFLVQFVDLPDTFTEGETLDEALFNASEVLSGMLAWHLEQGHVVQPPARGLEGSDVHYITPDSKTQSALLLRAARAQRTFADLARALETSWPAAKRLEDASHWPSLKTLDRAARVLGKRLVLSFE
jgi:antitoxin HicB